MTVDVERGQQALEPQEDLSQYGGQWVVLRDGHVVAHGPDPAALWAESERRESDVLLPVPPPGADYFL